MKWTDWLAAVASAIAILAALIGLCSYIYRKWMTRRKRQELERLIRYAEIMAERDLKAGLFDEPPEDGTNSN